MKISSKSINALRFLTDLAEHYNQGFISLNDVSRRQEISKKYLEQIIPLFHNSDVLKANRGAHGGYALAKSPDKYTVGDILRITEDTLSPAEEKDLPIWEGLSNVINDYLDGITLQDIVDKRRSNYANDYVI